MLGQTLYDAIKTMRAYPEQDAVHNETRNRFKLLVQMNKDIWTHQYEHWKKMGCFDGNRRTNPTQMSTPQRSLRLVAYVKRRSLGISCTLSVIYDAEGDLIV